MTVSLPVAIDASGIVDWRYCHLPYGTHPDEVPQGSLSKTWDGRPKQNSHNIHGVVALFKGGPEWIRSRVVKPLHINYLRE